MYNFHISHGFAREIKSHAQIEFVDVLTNKDTPLFIDPLLIQCFDDPLSQRVNYRLNCFFDSLFQLYKDPMDEIEIAEFFAHASEINETKTGYGNGFNGKGSSINGMVDKFSQLERIFASGINFSSPEDVPILLQGFAEDRFSDLITNVISDILNEFTIMCCEKYEKNLEHAAKPRYYWDEKSGLWKAKMGERLVLEGTPVLLLPKWFVRPRYFYNTGDFFRKRLVKFLQQDQFEKTGNKPTSKDLQTQLVAEYGCVHAAMLAMLKDQPQLLDQYKDDIGLSYSNYDMCLNDELLDEMLYNK